MSDEVGSPAATNEDSTALLIWLTSALNAPVADVAAIRAVMALTPLDSDLPVWTEAVADETTLASMPMIAEPRLLCTSVDTTLGIIVEPDSWPTLPPKGDSEMNVGVELWFPEDVAEFNETPGLPKKMLTLEAMVAVKAGTPIAVALCRPVAEVEEASKPVDTAVTLFPTMVMDDSDP